MEKYSFTTVLGLGLALAACTGAPEGSVSLGTDAPALRSLRPSERVADFDILVHTVRELYAPLRFKEKKFAFDFEKLAVEYRAMAEAAQDDSEGFGVLARFLAHLRDGHVSLSGSVGPNPFYNVPLYLTPVEGKALVARLYDSSLTQTHGIEVGDEIAEVDGTPTMGYLPTIVKYEPVPNDLSGQHRIYRILRRPHYMTDLKPQRPTVHLKVVKPDGRVLERTLVWQVENNSKHIDRNFVLSSPLEKAVAESYAESIEADMSQWGVEKPFFMTSGAQNLLGFKQVKPSEEGLKKHGLSDPAKAPNLFAGTYEYKGKRILFLRQPTYTVPDADARIAWFKALLEEHGPGSDVLVIDQTHNPGGSMSFAQNFVSLFANQQTRGLVNFLNADRRWLDSLAKWSAGADLAPEIKNLYSLGFKLVEDAYDSGQKITSYPIPIAGSQEYIRPASVTYEKPILMLIDELSGSCGDLVPALMKENRLATLFGARTMGLGGNVESAIVLPSSQIEVKLTRGFFATYSPEGKYDLESPIENNGVAPDLEYRHTVRDYRQGFTDYVRAFSDAAIALPPRQPAAVF